MASLATMEGNVLHQMFVPVGEDGVGHRVTFVRTKYSLLYGLPHFNVFTVLTYSCLFFIVS